MGDTQELVWLAALDIDLEVAVLGEPGERDLLLAIESPNLTKRPLFIEKERNR